jgi:transposase-like protein
MEKEAPQTEDGFEFSDPRFSDPEAAAEYLEQLRWADGVICPHCGESEREPYRLNSKATTRRLWKCRACRKQFTVMVGTIFESSHIPLNKWLAAFFLLCSSKKGMSAHQLHRMLKINYRSAWFLFHRIRHVMTQESFQELLGGVVEVDETYIGGKAAPKRKSGRPKPKKVPVVALVERDGRARSIRAANVTAKELQGAIHRHVDRAAHVMTDENSAYRTVGRDYRHSVIRHTAHWEPYARGEVTTNTVENFFSLLKRGLHGSYHHVSEAQLPRYLDEFTFRWNTRHNTDSQRTVKALQQIEGRRLKYRD